MDRHVDLVTVVLPILIGGVGTLMEVRTALWLDSGVGLGWLLWYFE